MMGWPDASTMHMFLITPYLIAVRRLIILGEVTTNYQLTPASRDFCTSLVGRSLLRH
jgi:hypothetical protein